MGTFASTTARGELLWLFLGVTVSGLVVWYRHQARRAPHDVHDGTRDDAEDT